VSRIGGRYCFFVKKYVNVERGGTPEMAMSEKIRNFA